MADPKWMTDTTKRPGVTPCPVRLRLSDGSTVDGIVWLLPDPARASGVTSVEMILDGGRDFIAVGLDRGGSLLISRNSVRTVDLAADGPGTTDLPDANASLDVVTLHLDSGEEVSGVLRAISPEGFSRMSDVMNAAGRFITLGSGDRLILVAKNRVVRVSF